MIIIKLFMSYVDLLKGNSSDRESIYLSNPICKSQYGYFTKANIKLEGKDNRGLCITGRT
jgi:hypothetical protein